tara:strand:- start:54 stop:257 length:204 start_codon:yes stop_codon:yes gene_type:complete
MTSIFILGAVVFLFNFTFFKIAAFKKVKSDQSWKKLFAVTLVDYLILIFGTLGTGILFITIYSIAHN